MIAVDTNILVYAHRQDSSFHRAADKQITDLAESDQIWAIPWPCLYEFLAIATHPKIYNPPTPLEDALIQVDCWLASPRLRLIGELEGVWFSFKTLLKKGRILGPQVHDARIAAICLQNGVTTLLTADRDFSRIEGLELLNPLL